MIDWLLDLVPLWVWVILAGVAILALWRLLGTEAALGAIAAAAGVLAYRSGRQSGGADALARQRAADDKAVKDHETIAREVGGLDDDDLDARNAPWVRKRGK